MKRAAALKAMSDHGLSQARACRLVGVDPKTVRRRKEPDNPVIRRRMREIAHDRRRFNGRLRDEFLNEEVFKSLADARVKLNRWRHDYNTIRPHTALNGNSPATARRALELVEGSTPGALAKPQPMQYQAKGLSF